MTEKKSYCFRWRCFHVQKAPPYKAVSFGGGDIHSITRSKAYHAAWRGALDDLRAIDPGSSLTGDLVPNCSRSHKLYHIEHHTKDFIYSLFVEDITK